MQEKINQLKEIPKMKEILSRFGGSLPTGICSGVTHREVEEMALESARLFGVGYIRRVIAGIDNYLTQAYLDEPKYNERNHAATGDVILDSTGYDFTSAEIGLPRSKGSLRSNNPDINIETIVRNDLGKYESAWGEIYLELVYKLSPKQD